MDKEHRTLSLESYWKQLDKKNYSNYLSQIEIREIKKYLQSKLNEAGINKEVMILDIGCGTGNIIKGAFIPILSIKFDKPIDMHIVATDIDNLLYHKFGLKELEEDTNKAGAKLDVVVNDLNFLCFSKSSFDMVTIIQSIQYVKSLDKSLKEIANLIKMGGILIFPITNKKSVKGILYKKLGKQKRFFYRYDYDIICNILREQSFEIVDIHGYSNIPFKRDSDSKLIPTFACIEALFLRNLKFFNRFSSNLIIVCRKI